MNNNILNKAELLFPEFHSYYKSPKILALCETKESPPFVFIIKEDSIIDVLISVSVEYTMCFNIVEVVTRLSKKTPVMATEPFYISAVTNSISFGQTAFDQFYLEHGDLLEMPVVSKQIN